MKGNIKFTDEKYKVDKSSIHGLGAIASNPIKKGELIGSAVDKEESLKQMGTYQEDTRTVLGRSMNHQNSENAIQKSENGALNVYAKSNIKQGDEITVNYNDAPEYIDKRSVKDYKEI